MRNKLVLLIVGTIVILSASPALAIGFYNITNNNPLDAGIGIAQLSVAVLDPGFSQVEFKFSNRGPFDSSITDVYFEDNANLFPSNPILGFYFYSSGVSFSQYADPTNLPSANTASPPFVTTPGLSADSDPQPSILSQSGENGVAANGVNPDEDLGILIDLVSATNVVSVINALSSGNLRIGIHVQGFASGGSESFVTGSPPPTNPVPEPATMLLFGVGLIGLAGFGRKKILKRK